MLGQHDRSFERAVQGNIFHFQRQTTIEKQFYTLHSRLGFITKQVYLRSLACSVAADHE